MISIAVLTPHAEPGPEAELPDMAAGRLTISVSRIFAPGAGDSAHGTPPTSPSGLRELTAPSVLDVAAAGFARGSVDVIGYASTSTGYALGFNAEKAMLEELAHRWSIPVAGTTLSAGTALAALNAHRVALVHPPWFADEMNDLGATYFRSQGFDVVTSESADLVNDPSRIEPDAVVEWVSRHVRDDADAVFIGGNGFRAARAIEELEEGLGRPVLESNQVLLWSILRQVGVDLEVTGYGRLFSHEANVR